MSRSEFIKASFLNPPVEAVFRHLSPQFNDYEKHFLRKTKYDTYDKNNFQVRFSPPEGFEPGFFVRDPSKFDEWEEDGKTDLGPDPDLEYDTNWYSEMKMTIIRTRTGPSFGEFTIVVKTERCIEDVECDRQRIVRRNVKRIQAEANFEFDEEWNIIGTGTTLYAVILALEKLISTDPSCLFKHGSFRDQIMGYVSEIEKYGSPDDPHPVKFGKRIFELYPSTRVSSEFYGQVAYSLKAKTTPK